MALRRKRSACWYVECGNVLEVLTNICSFANRRSFTRYTPCVSPPNGIQNDALQTTSMKLESFDSHAYATQSLLRLASDLRGISFQPRDGNFSQAKTKKKEKREWNKTGPRYIITTSRECRIKVAEMGMRLRPTTT